MSKLAETKLGEDLANDIKIIDEQVSFLKQRDDAAPAAEYSVAIAALLSAKAKLLRFVVKMK